MVMVKMMMVMAMMMGAVMGDFVDDTCKRTLDNALCLSLLRSDPRSSSANITGLALILVDKIKALAMETLGQINQTYKTKPMLKRSLDECNQRYKKILTSDVVSARSAIIGDPKFADGPIAEARYIASECEGKFLKGQSPLTGLTQRMVKICDVTEGIIDMLL